MRINKSELNSFPRFAFVEEGTYVVDSLCFFTGKDLDTLCNLLNSKYAAYYFFRNIAILDNGGMQMRQQYVENIPFPRSLKEYDQISDNDTIFKCFGFTEKESDFMNLYLEERVNEIFYKTTF